MNSARNVTRFFILDSHTDPSPIFADEESELAQGHMGSKWQNNPNY